MINLGLKKRVGFRRLPLLGTPCFLKSWCRISHKFILLLFYTLRVILVRHEMCINITDMTDQHCKQCTCMFQNADHLSHYHINLVRWNDMKVDRELA